MPRFTGLALGRVPRKNYAVVNQSELVNNLAELPNEVRRPLVRGLVKIFQKQAIDERLNYETIERSLGEVFSGHIKGLLSSAFPATSDYYRVLFGGWLYTYATLTTVGSTHTVIEVYRSTDNGANFTLLEYIFIEPSSHVAESRWASRVEEGDLLYWKVSAVGTSAAGLFMQLLIQNYARSRPMETSFSFNPLSIAWTHAYWTEGTDFIAQGYTNGSAIGTWPDEVATSDLAQATAGFKPTLVTADSNFNGQNIIRFDGTDDRLVNDWADLSQPNEFFVVARARSIPTWAYIFDGINATDRNALYHDDGTDKWNIFAGLSLEGAASNTLAHVFRVIFNGASSSLFIDEVNTITGNAGAQASSGLTVGTRYNGVDPGPIDVAFIAVKNGALTATERMNLHQWARTHYGTG